MSFKKKFSWTLVFCAVSVLFCFTATGFAAAQPSKDFVAVAFTGENYTGASWVIPSAGDYDLWFRLEPPDEDGKYVEDVFNLPNDSICSIRVRPGYKVTLFQHADLEGDSAVFVEDTPSLNNWNRKASSMRVETNAERYDDPKWMDGAAKAGDFVKPSAGGEADSKRINEFTEMYEHHWYGETTDNERIEMGGELLRISDALGYGVSEWAPNTFAQQMNNFYDWRKDINVWQVACLVLNVDPEAYKDF